MNKILIIIVLMAFFCIKQLYDSKIYKVEFLTQKDVESEKFYNSILDTWNINN